ncbi:MAG: M48 family metallopeptidase [Rhodocyclaceae bacterium]|jgi:predicted Zn-dependent protease|nr:M48 family metallopeptidase [Rhodocyclaceae bacterium]
MRRVGAALALGFGVACQSVQTTGAGVVGVERSQSMLVSAESVVDASARQYQQMLELARRKNLLNRDGAQVARVRGVADRLISQVRVFRPDAMNWRWEVNVLDSDQLNAWCMAGGKIVVYSGLLDKLKLSDDELAAVMGHEIAHALREHARERISRAMATGIGVSIVGAAIGVGGMGQDLMGKVAEVTFELPNSRLHETEADRMGVELAARAGFDPRAAVTLWQKLAGLAGGAPPQWLSTHPNHESRQQDLARYAERVMPLYEAARP